jgi:hypothetical protein
MLLPKVVEEIKKYFLLNNFHPPPPPKVVLFLRQRGKILQSGKVTDDNMAHEHCVLDI